MWVWLCDTLAREENLKVVYVCSDSGGNVPCHWKFEGLGSKCTICSMDLCCLFM